jgi:tetratricopeptide (TPR) repeat protein
MVTSPRGLTALVCSIAAWCAVVVWAQNPKSEKETEALEATTVKFLAEADKQYGSRDLVRAGESYRRVLDLPAENHLRARANYGLARIAALSNDPHLAAELFQRTLEMSPDDDTKSWVYLYLGRLADVAGDREQAIKNYRTVLGIQSAPEQVKNTAQKRLGQLLKR